MKYKVGDRVVVREDLKADQRYHNVYVIEDMSLLSGETVTITDAKNTKEYGVHYIIKEFGCIWQEDMFSGLADEINAEQFCVSEEDFLAVLSR